MKVIILTGEPFPNGMAATSRIKCYARALKEGGMDCEVLIYRRTEVYGQPPKNTDGIGSVDSIPFRYIGFTPLRGNNVFIRQINDRLDILKTERYLNNKLNKGDVLFLYMGGKVELMLRFMKVAHRKEAFCIRDLCELPYGTMVETQRIIRKRKFTIEQQFPLLDGIISISDALMNMAKSYTLPTCKHIKVPIMVDFDYYCIETRAVDREKPFIFHAGTLSQQKDGILGMIEAFGMAKEKLVIPIRYILTGEVYQSSHQEELKKIISKYHLEDSIEFVGYLTREQVKDYLSRATLVISNRPKSKQDYYGFSTKLGEYLAAATPLLLTNWGEAINWLENGKSAYITEPGDIIALSEAIVHVFTHQKESNEVGIAGQEICRQCFDYRNWSKPIVEYMNELGK